VDVRRLISSVIKEALAAVDPSFHQQGCAKMETHDIATKSTDYQGRQS